jgi:diaminopimelate decarboxylase
MDEHYEKGVMDREELNEWIRLGPICITMNSFDTVDITNRELVTAGSMVSIVLVRCENLGILTKSIHS